MECLDEFLLDFNENKKQNLLMLLNRSNNCLISQNTNLTNMITSVHIKNFKSVYDLTLDLGSFNVLIGENGCGKSNILEGITFGAAACANKLDSEFLGSRGVRVTNPEFMFSAFNKKKANSKIEICFKTDNDNDPDSIEYKLSNKKMKPNTWVNERVKKRDELAKSILRKEADLNKEKKTKEVLKKKKSRFDGLEELANTFLKEVQYIFTNAYISNFINYSPEESSLRKFNDSTQIYPIGIKGAGLFQYIKELNDGNKRFQKMLEAIKENLILLDWYDDFELPENLMRNEYKLQIKDKYLASSLQFFDQRSTNEGFLYLLFYSALFISDETPQFFGIDNIDASFNPKLCTKLTQNLAALAKKNKKQAIVSTHNPAILDGLDLENDDHRLFVVSRNEKGYTVANRIGYNAKRRKNLSEIWRKGFIGGLPENF